MRKRIGLGGHMLLVAAVCIGTCPSLWAGDIKGRVIESGERDSTRAKGVPHATVVLTGKAKYEFSTDQDGNYSKKGLTNGDYQLDVKANQYILVYAPDPVTINDGENKPDYAVMDKEPKNKQGAVKVGVHFAEYATGNRQASTYAAMWGTLTRSSFTADYKRLVLDGILEKDPDVIELYAPLKEYKDTSFDSILAAQKKVAAILSKGERIPSTSEFGVKDAVLKDVVIHELAFKGTVEKNTQFLDALDKTDDSMGWKQLTPDVKKKYDSIKAAGVQRDRPK